MVIEQQFSHSIACEHKTRWSIAGLDWVAEKSKGIDMEAVLERVAKKKTTQDTIQSDDNLCAFPMEFSCVVVYPSVQ